MSIPATSVKVLRVVDWDKHYENNRTRQMKAMAWVPIPNKHDGYGFTHLLTHDNGGNHLAAWILILQVASKCHLRGTLLRDSRTLASHDCQSLALITRLPAGHFEEAIPRLVEIGWLEWIHIDAGGCVVPASKAHPPDVVVPDNDEERKGIERNGREGKRTEHSPPANGVRVISPHPATLDPLFQEFWQAIRENRDDAIAKDHDGMWPCWNRLDGSQRVLALENTRLRTIHSQQIFGDLRHYLFSGEYQRPPKTPPKQVEPKTYLQQVAEGITND